MSTPLTYIGCLYLTEEESQQVVQQIELALSDFRWAERAVPGTNFQGSILGLEFALNILRNKA